MRSAKVSRIPLKWESVVIKIWHGIVNGAIAIWNIIATIAKSLLELVKWLLNLFLYFTKGFLSPQVQIFLISIFCVGVLGAVVWQYGQIGQHWLGQIKTPSVISKAGITTKSSIVLVTSQIAWAIGIVVGLIINTFQLLPHMGSLFTQYSKAFAAMENEVLEDGFKTFADKARSPMGWNLTVVRTVSMAFFALEFTLSTSYAWQMGILTMGPQGLIVGLAYILLLMVFGPIIAIYATSSAIALIAHFADEN